MECTSAHYLGGYIGDDKTKGDWLKKCIGNWDREICDLRKTANKYPCVVQSEWIFLQCVTKDTVKSFTGWENFYRKLFCLVFYLEIKNPPPNCRSSKYISVE